MYLEKCKTIYHFPPYFSNLGTSIPCGIFVLNISKDNGLVLIYCDGWPLLFWFNAVIFCWRDETFCKSVLRTTSFLVL
jgi:hypothetical protein